MDDRSRKPKHPRNPNQLDKLIVHIGSGRMRDEALTSLTPEGDGKDPAAVSLGGLGVATGAPARAEKLTLDERRENARKEAAAR